MIAVQVWELVSWGGGRRRPSPPQPAPKLSFWGTALTWVPFARALGEGAGWGWHGTFLLGRENPFSCQRSPSLAPAQPPYPPGGWLGVWKPLLLQGPGILLN